jgi:membrane protease YdiL (CAAX protease family)
MSSFPPPTTAPAGWYPDPYGGGSRYFDGRAWAPLGPAFDEREAHPTLPLAAAVGALAILAASLVVGRALGAWLDDYDWPTLLYVVLSTAIGYGPSLAWCLYVRRRWGGGRLAGLGWRFRVSDVGWGPVTYLVSFGVELGLGALMVALDVPFTSNIDDVSDLKVDRVYLVSMLIVIVIVAPMIEELIFRGVVLRGLLSRTAPAVAIGLQGVLFGCAHIDPARGTGNIGLAILLSGVGITLGASAYLFRRIGPTVVAHGILNGIAMLLVLSGWLDDVDTELDVVVRAIVHAWPG